MQYQAFSQDTNHYRLGDGFCLVRANPDHTDFVHHWTAYRPNESFHQDWRQRYADLLGVPVCFWIEHESERIGGCLTFPNMIAELFLMPPFEDYEVIISKLLALVQHWSNPEQAIMARYILPEQVDIFTANGFELVEQRQFMIRPVLPYTVEFDAKYELSKPILDTVDEYADVFLAAFSGGLGEYGQRDKAAHLKSLTNLLEGDVLIDASLVVRDKENNEIVCICLVSDFAGHASINFVVTHPNFQKQGLGKQAMQYAINAVYGIYPWMILAVTHGNPAEKLYHNLGFKRGVMIGTMRLQS